MKQRIVGSDGNTPSIVEGAKRWCYGLMACGLLLLLISGADLLWDNGDFYRGSGGMSGLVIMIALLASTAWITPLLIRQDPRALWPARIIVTAWAIGWLSFAMRSAVEGHASTAFMTGLVGLNLTHGCWSLLRARIE